MNTHVLSIIHMDSLHWKNSLGKKSANSCNVNQATTVKQKTILNYRHQLCLNTDHLAATQSYSHRQQLNMPDTQSGGSVSYILRM